MKMGRPDSEALLTCQEVAARLRLSLSTVGAMFRRRELPAVVVREGRGKKQVRQIRRMRQVDLDEWIKKNWQPAVRQPKTRRPLPEEAHETTGGNDVS